MRSPCARAPRILVGVLFWALLAPVAQADRLCVATSGTEDPELPRFVAAEVRRHPGHVPVETDCDRTLHLEVITIEGRRWLTLWLDGQVPARAEVDGTVEKTLEALISKVLGSDPVVLSEDMGAYLGAIADSGRTSADGAMLWGFEAFQTLVAGQDGTDALPGLAVRLRRELGPFTVGGRGAVSFFPSTPSPGERTRVTILMQVEPDFAWMVSPDSATSFYLGASLALALMHFEGHTALGPESLTKLGVTAGIRIGVELLRMADFRLDLFAQVALPLFVSNSDESTIIDQWTPAGHLGMGIAF